MSRRKRPNKGELDYELRQRLELGRTLIYSELNDMPDEVFRDDWSLHRDEILNDWIRDRPGTRPWGFWAFEAPENHYLHREHEFLEQWGAWRKGEKRRFISKWRRETAAGRFPMTARPIDPGHKSFMDFIGITRKEN